MQDYTEMQWRNFTTKKPDDFVVATGKAFSVRQFIETASKLSRYKNILARKRIKRSWIY